MCKKTVCNHFRGVVAAEQIADLLAEPLDTFGVSKPRNTPASALFTA